MNEIQVSLVDQADHLLRIVTRSLADAGQLGHQDAWWLFAAGIAAVVLSIVLMRAR